MAAPPVPPRPMSARPDYFQDEFPGGQPRHNSSAPPALPPLPPTYHRETLAPGWNDPMPAPRPQKLMSNVPDDMAQSLEQSMQQSGFSMPVPAFSGGFAVPAPPPPQGPPGPNYGFRQPTLAPQRPVSAIYPGPGGFAAPPHVTSIASIWPIGSTAPIPVHVAEALYLRGTLEASGAFPEKIPRDQRAAFRDFEAAARQGYAPGWFKLGRDYESVKDTAHAREVFERGARLKETSCLYRLGMAHLLGQLGFPSTPSLAVNLLREAADLATVDVPQPSYVFGMLLLGEFTQVTLPPALLAQALPAPTPSNPHPRASEARRRIERSAYLGFGPALYKIGWAYEHAKMGCTYDPLLSVQYYSAASQRGEGEADMALSKWFLCGSEGAFDKDENLAVVFAEKAANRGLASGMFAMGYYCEVGVGIKADRAEAIKWYQKSAAEGNTEAPGRLAALSGPNAAPLSRAEHESLTDSRLPAEDKDCVIM
ncbi:hypothetical protein FS749_013646 [Ceratobasidium sp. UAMH 11750]|nr:hypothetical protein FS749_013646 [Ceratobasidium sp. UAMH 11750]